MYTLAVSNQKGGVGKSTTVSNLAVCLGETLRVLVVDMDPQGACSIALGLDPGSFDRTMYTVLVDGMAARDVIVPTEHGYDLLPADLDLAEAELRLSTIPLRELVLDRALGALHDRYDVIVIDTPPTLGLLTINAFAAADSVLVPISPQLLSLRGMVSLLETIQKLKSYKVNERLKVLAILPTRYDPRLTHAREVLDYLHQFYSAHDIRVLDPVRATTQFDEATNRHIPFVTLYPDHPAAQAYREAADYVRSQIQT